MKRLIQTIQKAVLNRPFFLPLILMLITFLVRVPLYKANFWRTPDSVEYINVAENITQGLGLTQSIKWHFFESYPVVTSALHGKPVLTSIVFSAVLFFTDNVYVLQLFLFSVMAVVVLLIFFLARQFFSPVASFALCLLVALNPNILITNRLILSEPIFYLFVISAFLIFFRNKKQEHHYNYILLGACTALAYLTRSEGIFLLFTFILFSLKNPKGLLNMISAFVLVALPYFIMNTQINGSPFYSYTIHHFTVKHFSEGMNEGYGKEFPTVASFVISHLSWIVKSISNNLLANIKSLVSLQYLGMLSIAYLFLKKKDHYQFLPFLLFGSLVFINFSLFWSSFLEPERHLGTVFICLLFPIFSLISHSVAKKFIVMLFVLLTLMVYIPYDLHRIRWVRTEEPKQDAWNHSDSQHMLDWIRQNTDKASIIASSNPWMMYLYTGRPSILLPTNIQQQSTLEVYISEYQVNYLVTTQDQHLVEKYNKMASFGDQHIYSIVQPF